MDYCAYLASLVGMLRDAEAVLEANDRRIPFLHILATTIACHLELAERGEASPAAERAFVSSIEPSLVELNRHVAAILKTPTADEVESFQKTVVEISRAFLERDPSM